MVYVLFVYNKKEKYNRITTKEVLQLAQALSLELQATKDKSVISKREVLELMKTMSLVSQAIVDEDPDLSIRTASITRYSGNTADSRSPVMDTCQMTAFNIQEALIWKEKIESVINQHQESQATNGNKHHSFEYKSGMDNGRSASSSDHKFCLAKIAAVATGYNLDLVFSYTRSFSRYYFKQLPGLVLPKMKKHLIEICYAEQQYCCRSVVS